MLMLVFILVCLCGLLALALATAVRDLRDTKDENVMLRRTLANRADRRHVQPRPVQPLHYDWEDDDGGV